MPLWKKEKVSAKDAAKNAKKETRREVRSGQRDIDREMRDLDKQEKYIMAEIKKRAKTATGPNDVALKSLAKNLVQVRAQRDKMYGTRAHLGAVGMNANNMATQVAAAAAMGSVTEAMKTANNAVDTKEINKIMNEFARQNETMAIREEMMDDALADAFDTDELDAEADQVTSQVLAELGVEMDSQMVGLSAPSKVPAKTVEVEEEEALNDALPDLRARLDAL